MEYERNAGLWRDNSRFYEFRIEHRWIVKKQSWILGIQKTTQMDLERNMNKMHDFGKTILDSMDLKQNIDGLNGI